MWRGSAPHPDYGGGVGGIPLSSLHGSHCAPNLQTHISVLVSHWTESEGLQYSNGELPPQRWPMWAVIQHHLRPLLLWKHLSSGPVFGPPHCSMPGSLQHCW
jgi:hypothetical protein